MYMYGSHLSTRFHGTITEDKKCTVLTSLNLKKDNYTVKSRYGICTCNLTHLHVVEYNYCIPCNVRNDIWKCQVVYH